MRIYNTLLFGMSLGLLVAGQAMATPFPPNCTGGLIYDAQNGTGTLPGLDASIVVGSASNQTCQIGNLHDSGQGKAGIDVGALTSVYSFYFGGGQLNIDETIGNNGRLPNTTIYAEFYSLASLGDTTGTQIGSTVPFYYISGGGEVGPQSVFSGILDAGYYALLTTADVQIDPKYQAVFSFNGVPEPATLSLLGAGLAGIAMRRRKKKTA